MVDRTSLSLCPVMRIVKQVLDAGATIRVLDFPSLDLTAPEGRGFLATGRPELQAAHDSRQCAAPDAFQKGVLLSKDRA
jgi:hypothetical protein